MNTKEENVLGIRSAGLGRLGSIGKQITAAGVILGLLLGATPSQAKGGGKSDPADQQDDHGHQQPNELILLGVEPNLAARELIISGLNFGGNTFLGSVTLYAPTLGQVDLVLKRYSGYTPGIVQELAVGLPDVFTNYPGTFTLTMKTGNGASKADSLDLSIGATGLQGPKGETGEQGEVGPQGPQGDKGDTGEVGPQGPVGMTGAHGEQGPIGLTGPVGPQGEQGVTGPVGPQGPQGEQGPIGLTGAQGEQGIAGPVGPQGLKGDPGEMGPQGPIGLTGPQGEQGPIGLTGSVGPQGPAGNAGPVGPQGPIGPTGAQGIPGPIGLTGPMGPEGPQGVQGLTGPTGPVGPQGDPGLIFTGDWITGVTYLENFVVTYNGSTWISQRPNSSVTPADGDDWTTLAQKGDDGDAGPQGEVGPEGPQGPIGPMGPMGPRGSDGIAGPQGPQGIQGVAGPVGPTGPQGEQGPEGPQGPAGVAPFSLNGKYATFGGSMGLGTATPNGELHVTSPLLGSAAIDQTQLSGATYYPGASKWQSFTAGANGTLTKLTVKCRSAVSDTTASPGFLNIYEGHSKSGPLCASIPIQVPASGNVALRTFAIPTLVNLVAGEQYTWELTAPNFTSGRGWLVGSPGNPYPSGSSPNSSIDFIFRTQVAPVLGQQDGLVVRAGKVGVNTSNPDHELDVNGTLRATTIAGNGSGLTGLPASALTGTINNDRISLDAAEIPNHSANKITSGVLSTARIPGLSASKITSGTINNARISLDAAEIPEISASKITSGTLGTGRVPNLSASKITSGTLGANRIPNLDASKISTGTLGTGRIPGLSATKITSGSFGASRIGTGAITTAKLQDAAVTIDKIGQNAVGSGKLAPDSVKTGKIVNLAVTTEKIADAAITTDKIADEAVGAGRIANNAVRDRHIQAGAVTSSKVNFTTGAVKLSNSGITLGNPAGDGTGADNDFKIVRQSRSWNGNSNTALRFHVPYVSTHFVWTFANGQDGNNNTAAMLLDRDRGLYLKHGVHANSLTTSSDARLKNSVKTLEETLPAIMKLRPVEYRLNKDGASGQAHIGFIAQEVQEVFPETVSTNGEYLGVNYGDFGPIAIKAIQEQQEQIKEKDARIKSLEDRLSRLESLMQKMADSDE